MKLIVKKTGSIPFNDAPEKEPLELSETADGIPTGTLGYKTIMNGCDRFVVIAGPYLGIWVINGETDVSIIKEGTFTLEVTP